ncbi:hypothetical protein AXG93_638s1060 [Marchantia polymorpha subsp. ruderalis]|uniref:Uncharacterized protein n=1 Tax=Marchantia polymorpha subsp. ruderalis TaxID=1480154 RepID=A0A176W516_MARPO|nr:hypothetical protein AXG93_638s1060 [Marchantia polymorpha subsp. ruderalis]
MHIGKDVTADPEAVYSEKSRLIGSGPANLQELDRVRIDELSQITPWRMYAVSAQKNKLDPYRRALRLLCNRDLRKMGYQQANPNTEEFLENRSACGRVELLRTLEFSTRRVNSGDHVDKGSPSRNGDGDSGAGPFATPDGLAKVESERRDGGRSGGLNTVTNWALKACLLAVFLSLAFGSFLLYWATFWGNRVLSLGASVLEGTERRVAGTLRTTRLLVQGLCGAAVAGAAVVFASLEGSFDES